MNIVQIVKLNLFVKMLILLFISTSVPLSVLGYFAYTRSNEQLEKVASNFLVDHLQQNSERLTYFFHAVNQYSESLLASQRLQALLVQQDDPDLNEISFMQEMSSLLYGFNEPYDVQIYPVEIDRFSNFVRRYSASPVTAETEWFAKARQMEGKGFWYTVPSVSRAEPALYYVRLIRSVPDLRHLGIVLIGVPATMLANELMIPTMYNNFQLTVLDSEGRSVLTKRSDAGTMPQLAERIEHPESGELFHKAVTYDGVSVFVASRTVGPEQWSLIEIIPSDDLTGSLNQIKGYPFHIFLIIVPVITFFLILITRHFTVPLEVLSSLMRRAQLGELKESDLYVNRSDEVGYLMRGYNTMIGGMKRLLASTKRIEREKNSYELQMLMNQINPHFLYNTLESIKWQANSGQTGQIGVMVQSLVNVLRFSINDGNAITTLERELGHTRSYLDIELIRCNNAFEVFYQIPANMLNASCLKLVIQPVVENAVRHGMYKLKPGEGKIIIQVYTVEGDMYCRVSDNGPGCDADSLNRRLAEGWKPAEGEGGIGLHNVHRRLQLEFGERYGVEISASQGQGTSVLICFPLLATKEAMKKSTTLKE